MDFGVRPRMTGSRFFPNPMASVVPRERVPAAVLPEPVHVPEPEPEPVPDDAKRRWRHMTTTELKKLADLWPTQATDPVLSAVFDRAPTVLRRIAMETLGLPPRKQARADALRNSAWLLERKNIMAEMPAYTASIIDRALADGKAICPACLLVHPGVAGWDWKVPPVCKECSTPLRVPARRGIE